MQITYTTLVDACVRTGDLFLAEEMLRDMQSMGVPPNTITFNILLRGYCQWSSQPIQVPCLPTQLSSECFLEGHSLVTETFRERLLARFSQCWAVAETREGNRISVAFIRAPRGCAQLRCVCGGQGALATLRSMGMAGVVPSTDTFNTLMSACLSRGDPAAVLRLFRRLISLGHSPDALSYTALIASLTRLGRPEDAVSPPPPWRIRTSIQWDGSCGHGWPWILSASACPGGV